MHPPDIIEQEFKDLYELCRPYTMTSVERLYALFNAIRYVVKAGIEGDFVECGVWKGGSVMMMAACLKSLGITDRPIYLFDTFDGMSPPGDEDVDWQGISAKKYIEDLKSKNEKWCYSSFDEVQSNLEKAHYPMELFKCVQGDVAKTIPAQSPKKISLLRLDTDFYESTRHELEYLFPRLSQKGILIIDDYGYHLGARKAVDEYFSACESPYYLNRIDHTGRSLIKA